MERDGQTALPGEATPELIARARHDRAAFGELYDLYLPRVYGLCRRYSRTREEAEDLTAATFERALAGIGRYEDQSLPFSRWLLRIARNVLINHARGADRTISLGDSDPADRDGTSLDDWEEAYWLRMHLRALPVDQQEVVRLRFYEDNRFQDVAARMGRSEGAVKQLLRRALRALHGRMQAEEGAANER